MKQTSNYYFIENFPYAKRKAGESMNFAYHINSFSFPINHTHTDYWEFTIIIAGELFNHTQNGKQHYVKNQMFVTPSDEAHYLIINKNPTQYINIAVRKNYLEELLKYTFPNNFEHIRNIKSLQISDHAIQKITKILYSTNLPQNNKPQKLNALIQSAFLIILQKISEHVLKSEEDSRPDWFKELENIINSSETPSFTVNDLCEQLHYSRTHLSRLFRGYLGISPHEYLLKLKMEYAQNLLMNTQFSILDISELLSYSHSGQFCKVFKQHFQLTPSEFRQQNKTETAQIAAYWNNSN